MAEHHDVSAWLAADENEKVNITKVKLQAYLRDRNLPTSGNKAQLSERVKGASKMVFIDKSISRKFDEERAVSKLITPFGELLPSPESLTYWTSDNTVFPEFSDKELYNYMVLSRNTYDHGPLAAKKELTRASQFYIDGHVSGVQYHGVNDESSHCFVRGQCLPSIPGACSKKKPAYKIWICLSKVTSHIHSASCDCVAGKGESCNHIAALCYALADNTQKRKEGKLAPTAQACGWIKPRARSQPPRRAEHMNSDSTSVVVQESHSESKIQAFREKVTKYIPNAAWLKNFIPDDEHTIPSTEADTPVLLPQLHHIDMCLHDSVDLKTPRCVDIFSNYFKSLSVSHDECTQIYDATRGQSSNESWMTARTGRLTSSFFGHITRRKPSTPPENLLKTVLHYNVPYQGKAMKHGLRYELIARDNYLHFMRTEHPPFQVRESSLCVNPLYPHLGASPDGMCSCDHCGAEGLVEIKCPFSFKDVHPIDIAKMEHTNFFCCLDANGKVSLKRTHLYYYQIQGQMGISSRQWCDFVVWTFKGMVVERITFDCHVWQHMLEKLNNFYVNAVIPELFSQRVKRGKKLY